MSSESQISQTGEVLLEQVACSTAGAETGQGCSLWWASKWASVEQLGRDPETGYIVSGMLCKLLLAGVHVWCSYTESLLKAQGVPCGGTSSGLYISALSSYYK
eukprot:897483-Pelagomonas_calceolata.AAC.1